jgi:large-conductance mechanosensitive channel
MNAIINASIVFIIIVLAIFYVVKAYLDKKGKK